MFRTAGDTRALVARGPGPPSQIVGEATESSGECCAALTDRLSCFVKRVTDTADRQRVRDHDHFHLGQGAVSSNAGMSAGEAACRAAGDRGRTPEPLLE